MKEENINALDEIHKGAYMGMDALHFISDKIEDEKFKERRLIWQWLLPINYKNN